MRRRGVGIAAWVVVAGLGMAGTALAQEIHADGPLHDLIGFPEGRSILLDSSGSSATLTLTNADGVLYSDSLVAAAEGYPVVYDFGPTYEIAYFYHVDSQGNILLGRVKNTYGFPIVNFLLFAADFSSYDILFGFAGGLTVTID